MANLKSAQKRARQAEKQHIRNASRRTEIKTAVSKVRVALQEHVSEDKARELLRKAESTIARAKSRGALHPNTAARKVSRISRQVAETYSS
jgi:small subunit ribosomal protein S20